MLHRLTLQATVGEGDRSHVISHALQVDDGHVAAMKAGVAKLKDAYRAHANASPAGDGEKTVALSLQADLNGAVFDTVDFAGVGHRALREMHADFGKFVAGFIDHRYQT